jgi:hypothetical protein
MLQVCVCVCVCVCVYARARVRAYACIEFVSEVKYVAVKKGLGFRV